MSHPIRKTDYGTVVVVGEYGVSYIKQRTRYCQGPVAGPTESTPYGELYAEKCAKRTMRIHGHKVA